jgi:hypothetical protein
VRFPDDLRALGVAGMTAATAPKYREEIRGRVRDMVDDCTLAMRNEIRSSDDFIFTAEDTSAWSEFADLLTLKELRHCFAKARAQADQL